jgi:hypothetical protein
VAFIAARSPSVPAGGEAPVVSCILGAALIIPQKNLANDLLDERLCNKPTMLCAR